MTAQLDAYFTRIDEHTFQPEQPCAGAWNDQELHVAPVNGLLVHTMEQWLESRGAGRELAASRISVDYLGVIDFTPVDVAWEVLRPGRAVELVEGVLSQHGRPVMRARVWRLAVSDTAAVEGGLAEPLPHPDECATTAMDDRWPGDYVRTLDVRVAGEVVPGRGRVWMRTPLAIVAGEQSSMLARSVLIVDTSNGAAIRESPAAWQYPNLDLTIHLLRQPVGDWVGLDASVAFGASGQGITSAVLHDEQGQVGRAELGLLVRAR